MQQKPVTTEVRDSMPPESFADPPRRWFVRGAAVGMLLMASVNAISYFFRSAHWGTLVGRSSSLEESVGFPFKVWEAGNTYGGMFVDYPMLVLNIAVAAVVGAVFGLLTAWKTSFLNGLIQDMQAGWTPQPSRSIQFSLRGLMFATLIAAVAATVARHYAARPETLVAIYALGPALLVAIAMLPRRLSWQQRVTILVPASYALIAAAIAVGHSLNMEFDKVLMGIFLCWTPQSALAAIALTASIFIAQVRQNSKPNDGHQPAT